MKNSAALIALAFVSVASADVPEDQEKVVVGLNVQQHSGTFDAAGKAFTHELGAHSIRLPYGHGQSEAQITDSVNWAASKGIDVIFTLGYSDGCNPETADGRQCYADRSARLAKNFGDKVKIYEVWNEWFGGFGLGRYPACKPLCEDPAAYADLLCRTFTAVKAVRPNALVAGGGFAGTNGAYAFAPRLMRAGAGECMDMFVVHPYPQLANTACPTRDNPKAGADCVFDHISRLDNIIKDNNSGRRIPFAITETGWYGESTAPTFLREIYARAKDHPIYGIWWYELEDHPSSGSPKGLVRPNNTRKPVFETFKAAATTPPVEPPPVEPPPVEPPPVTPPPPAAQMLCEHGADVAHRDAGVIVTCQ